MPIKLDCPRCKKILSIPSKKAGSYALCPSCNGRFWVPEDVPQEKDLAPPPVVPASAGPVISPPRGMSGSSFAAPPGVTVPAGAPPMVIPVGLGPPATEAAAGSKGVFPPNRGAASGLPPLTSSAAVPPAAPPAGPPAMPAGLPNTVPAAAAMVIPPRPQRSFAGSSAPPATSGWSRNLPAPLAAARPRRRLSSPPMRPWWRRAERSRVSSRPTRRNRRSSRPPMENSPSCSSAMRERSRPARPDARA